MITVYSTPSCLYCKKIKDLLNQKHITFKEVNVESDEAGFNDMIAKNGGRMAVPTTDFNGKIYIGFTPDLQKEINSLQGKSS